MDANVTNDPYKEKNKRRGGNNNMQPVTIGGRNSKDCSTTRVVNIGCPTTLIMD
jgi:hypothetical protein